MINSYPIEEVIRGHLGTIKFVQGGFQIIKDDPEPAGRQTGPAGKDRQAGRDGPGQDRGLHPRGVGQQLRHGRAVGPFPGVRPLRQARNALPAGTGGGGLHHGGDGREELPRGQGVLLGQGRPQSGQRPTRAGRRAWRSGARNTASRMRSSAITATRQAASCSRRLMRSWPGRGSTAKTRPRAEPATLVPTQSVGTRSKPAPHIYPSLDIVK